MLERIPYFGISLTRLTVNEFVETVRSACEKGVCLAFSYAHFHTINLIQDSVYARDIFREVDVVAPDGVAVLWSTRLLGGRLFRDNIIVMEYAMAVLGPEACRRGWSIFLFGGDVDIASRAAEKLEGTFPGLRVIGTHHGLIHSTGQMEEVVAQIGSLRPTILLVGLGQPKQEEFIVRYRQQLAANAIVGVGGYLEKLARRDTIYPRWVNRTHLYWLYRLLTEPRRVWKRYSCGVLRFLWLVARTSFRRRQSQVEVQS